jgi:hypothetical protein
MASYSDNSGISKLVEEYRHDVRSTLYEINQKTDSRSRIKNRINVYGSLGYKIKGESSLHISYYGDIMPYRYSSSQIRNNYFGDGLTNENYNGQYHGTSLSFESKKVSTGVGYSYWTNHTTSSYTGADSYDNRNNNTAQTANAYVDFSQPLPKEWTLGFGARLNFVHKLNDSYSRQMPSSNQSTPAETLSEGVQDEYDANLYVSLSHKFKNNIDLSATFTGNYYSVEEYHKFNFLPTLSLTWPIREDHALQFSGYVRKHNPSYTQQGNYRYHTDDYNISMGNPNLRPQINYTTNLTYILNSRYNFSFIYRYADNYTVSDGFMSSDELVMITQPLNTNFSSDVAVAASFPVPILKWWRTQFDIMGYRQHYKADDWNGASYDITRFGAQASLDNYFTISKQRPQIELTLSAYGYTASQNTIHKSPASWIINAGAKWTFVKKQMVLSISCNDIFQSSNNAYRSIIPEQQQYWKSESYRSYTASLTWKFGNYQGTHIRSGGIDASRAQ